MNVVLIKLIDIELIIYLSVLLMKTIFFWCAASLLTYNYLLKGISRIENWEMAQVSTYYPDCTALSLFRYICNGRKCHHS